MKKDVLIIMMVLTTVCSFSQVEYTPVNDGLDSIIAYTSKLGYENVTSNDTISNGFRYCAWNKEYNSFVNIVTVPTKKKTYTSIVYTFDANIPSGYEAVYSNIPSIKPVNIEGFKTGLYKKWYIITDGNYKAICKALDKLNKTSDSCSYSYSYRGNTCKIYSYKRGNTYYSTVTLNGKTVSTATVNIRY